MHFIGALAVIALVAATPGSRHAGSFGWTHVRPLSGAAKTLVTNAAAESATVRRLLDALEATDVVAYVEVPADRWRAAPIASLTFVGASARQRFVLIRIDQWAATTVERAPAIAHELQHALEVGRDPAVRDAASLAHLYARIGWQAGDGQFETDGARDAERRARSEKTGS